MLQAQRAAAASAQLAAAQQFQAFPGSLNPYGVLANPFAPPGFMYDPNVAFQDPMMWSMFNPVGLGRAQYVFALSCAAFASWL
jgi:hypothetical protein